MEDAALSNKSFEMPLKHVSKDGYIKGLISTKEYWSNSIERKKSKQEK
jgi:hypothetical protein